MFHICKNLSKILAVECTADAVFIFLFVSQYLRPAGVCIAFGHCHVVPRLAELKMACVIHVIINVGRSQGKWIGRKKQNHKTSLEVTDNNRSSYLDINTYMLKSRHKNVTAISSDMWILATVLTPFLGSLFRHLQPAGRGRSSLRSSLEEVLSIDIFSGSGNTACLPHSFSSAFWAFFL